MQRRAGAGRYAGHDRNNRHLSAGCDQYARPNGTGPIQATDTPAPAVESPTPTLQPAEKPAALAIFGQIEAGLYFRGSPNPDALAVIDYSDFL